MSAADRSSGVSIGRDALGNVFVTGDGNTVEVVLTVVVANPRLQDAPAAALDNPYRGLDAFRETDSAVFFGREDLIARLWTRFHQVHAGPAPRLLPLLGASGSGKSSLVRAGLLPELVRQPIAGMRTPSVLVLRPGANPLQRLADVLTRIAPGERGVEPDATATSTAAVDALHRAALAGRDPGARVVLFVDQLEELFTECDSEPVRRAFLATLAHAAAQPDGVVSVIFAMRNDFAGSLRGHDAFALAAREHRFMVPPLSRQQLLDAIERPAAAVGHAWPAGLVESLVLQCEGRAGALPLLQFALRRLWPEHVAGRLAEQRWSSRLIEDFVVQAADALFEAGADGEPRDRQRIIRRAFVAMVQLGEGAADTRRVARLSELVAGGETAAQVRAVLAPFAAPDARLVTASELDGEPSYELAHEALIGSWDRLRGWLGNVAHGADAEEIRGELRLRRRLAVASAAWRGDPDALLRPPELDLVAALRDRDPGELSAREAEFVASSLAAWRRSLGWRRRALRAIGALSIALAVFAVGLAVLGVMTQRRTREADRLLAAADVERSRLQRLRGTTYLERGGAVLLDDRPMQALPYLVAARAEGMSGPVLQMLFADAARDLPLATMVGHSKALTAAAFSPDGTRVVTASNDDTARVWDAATGQLVAGPLVHANTVVAAAFSPDGRLVVTASADHTARVWSSTTGRPVAGPLAHLDRVLAAAFSPDSRWVVTASEDHTARVWSATTGVPRTGPLAHGNQVFAAAFSPDGRWIATASDTARIWNAETGELVARTLPHGDRVNAVAFSPDSRWIATGSDKHIARVWSAATGRPRTDPLEHPRGHGVEAVAFAGDDQLMTVSGGTVRFWNAATSAKSGRELEDRDYVRVAEFSPDRKWIVTAGDDRARVWDATTLAPVTGPLEHQAAVRAAAFSADGRRIVTAGDDRVARVWESRTGDAAKPGVESFAAIRAAAKQAGVNRMTLTVTLSADGTRVATSAGRMAQIWDTATGTPVTARFTQPSEIARTVLSPDGARLITTSSDHVARIWDTTTGELVTSLEHQGEIDAAAFSADGGRVVTASEDHTVQVWDAKTGQRLTQFAAHSRAVLHAAFSRDGTRVVTASNDDTACVWDARTGQRVAGPLAHREPVRVAEFSADGARVVTASDDGTARVWNAATGAPVTSPLVHQGAVRAAAFSPDGARVVTGSLDNTARVWDAATGRAVTGPLQHHGPVRVVTFSADSTRVLTASDDGTTRVWDAAMGQPVTRPLGAGRGVSFATFNPDGTRVIAVYTGPETEWTADAWTATVWPLAIDTGSLDDWQQLAACSPFALNGTALIANPEPRRRCDAAVKRALLRSSVR